VDNPYGLVEAMRDRLTLSYYLRWLAKNLAFLSCGTRLDSNNEPLNLDFIRSCLADLRASFDYLLINIGSAATSANAFLLSQCMDGVVLVVEANTTHRVLAYETKVAFETSGANLLGAILHNCDFTVPKPIESILHRFVSEPLRQVNRV
jgi:Mrp family chromosome partitioning ATPase